MNDRCGPVQTWNFRVFIYCLNQSTPGQRKTDRHYLPEREVILSMLKVYQVYLSVCRSAAMWWFQFKWKHHTTYRNSVQDVFVWTICVWQRLCWASSVHSLEASGWSSKTSMCCRCVISCVFESWCSVILSLSQTHTFVNEPHPRRSRAESVFLSKSLISFLDVKTSSGQKLNYICLSVCRGIRETL